LILFIFETSLNPYLVVFGTLDAIRASLKIGFNSKIPGFSFFLEKTYNRVFRLLGGIIEVSNSALKGLSL
jgi:hypothetical protein